MSAPGLAKLPGKASHAVAPPKAAAIHSAGVNISKNMRNAATVSKSGPRSTVHHMTFWRMGMTTLGRTEHGSQSGIVPGRGVGVGRFVGARVLHSWASAASTSVLMGSRQSCLILRFQISAFSTTARDGSIGSRSGRIHQNGPLEGRLIW
uniref:Uncharacterized protein n=1 Tax=Mucochytrium quahogii TaxID=96639 RepID=A0A7S2SJK9_9STRA|mmetsp:Transcript_19817/g.32562  ORF Transcript_19817/g.32562 Transcript_19817/m.32562 type:complete len:150 (+) Transcript_19817:409-858(+)